MSSARAVSSAYLQWHPFFGIWVVPPDLPALPGWAVRTGRHAHLTLRDRLVKIAVIALSAVSLRVNADKEKWFAAHSHLRPNRLSWVMGARSTAAMTAISAVVGTGVGNGTMFIGIGGGSSFGSVTAIVG
jgi:hypothetical protein